MSNTDKEKMLHCIETVTGDNLAGIMVLSEDEIRVDLYNYNEFFHIKSEQPIYFIIETGQVVSFHDNVDNGSGTRHHHERTNTIRDLLQM
ncbi:hypothetical protein FHW17_004093 [Phyllobacterium sp. P30BS-XVII]|nr:hypothetical protein [Phyllobacterium sp. P30BS-XVII]